MLSPRSGDLYAVGDPGSIRAEINRRFSEWLYPVVFVLVALYFAGRARSRRERHGWHIFAGIVLATALRGLGFLLVSKSGSSPAGAALVYVVPLATIAFFFWLVFMRSAGIATGRRGAGRLPLLRLMQWARVPGALLAGRLMGGPR